MSSPDALERCFVCNEQYCDIYDLEMGDPVHRSCVIDLTKIQYAGGGYFRMPGPKGKKTPTLHGPELLALVKAKLKGNGNNGSS